MSRRWRTPPRPPSPPSPTPPHRRTTGRRRCTLCSVSPATGQPSPEIADPIEAPYPTTEDARYLEALRAELARDPDNPVLALLDRPALTTAVTDGLAAGESVRTSAELVRALDLWLRSYDVRTSVSQAPPPPAERAAAERCRRPS
ncbi:hypothetical protein AB0M97_30270 [Streptomyces sp. NPDC051207]|uniref:hypothetical protein n=1 Tax=Streptomyces sp. NPDC051207 TaxID=3154641 RepID=UPI00343B4456